MNANDVMTEGPVTIRSTASIREALTLIQALEVRHLPVVGPKGDLVGMLSDRDLRALVQPFPFSDPKLSSFGGRLDVAVSYIMNSAVFSVQPDTDVKRIIDLMTDQKIGAVPVVDDAGGVVGIVTYVDLLRELVRFAPAN
jgi:CBS-domain-containing membrane protein